ncbi:hypothetical protein Tco_0941215 [Tanacetum coccineum]|uniref:DUF4283 domain-containing protein n=1 Tax=Tanacetum coccineum TaxID=301880 RepID=A0ABQ5DQS3_9ASTR
MLTLKPLLSKIRISSTWKIHQWFFVETKRLDERIVWIEISGLHLCAWGSNAFKKVAFHGEMFDIHVHELGTWSISITINSLDTSSNVDVNDIDKVADVVEENSIDDLNDLNDNLNDLAQEFKEDEVYMDDLNVNFLDQTHVPLKEEIPVPTFSNGGTSDLSHPHLQTDMLILFLFLKACIFIFLEVL